MPSRVAASTENFDLNESDIRVTTVRIQVQGFYAVMCALGLHV